MRGMGPGSALLATLCVGGCDSAPETSQTHGSHGRYIGIGIYAAGDVWAQVAAANPSRDAAAANLDDDDHVIVVVDSRTGEIRQCGNFSGHCIGMNPWSAPLGQGRATPVPLTKHAADLAREAERQAQPLAPASTDVNAAEAAPAPR